VKPLPASLLLGLGMGLGVLVLGISGGASLPGHPQGLRTLPVPATRASVLVIITNPASPAAMRATGALVIASARPREQVIILSSPDGAVLASSRAPGSPGIQVPVPPAPLPPRPTSFQEARRRQALQQYQGTVQHARAALRAEQQQELAAWAKSMMAKAASRPIPPGAQIIGASSDLGVAVSDISSLRQAGMGALNSVIVIEGVSGAMARSAPAPLTGLQASAVVVDGFPGTAGQEAAWQASLVQDGAARAVILTPATDSQLIPVVEQGLDGAVTDTLTSVLFGPGRYQLPAAALSHLRRLLRLLTVEYPDATASIDGYADSLPALGGNLLLSQRRAQAVAEWLIAHGVAAGRLQAFGYGDSDSVAPDSASGQPLNRRVVVVINPAASA
jgi:outer membrane protein OmpA-like peptidoglycan-associated protein